jgi:hypothetical protein
MHTVLPNQVGQYNSPHRMLYTCVYAVMCMNSHQHPTCTGLPVSSQLSIVTYSYTCCRQLVLDMNSQQWDISYNS